MRDKLKSYNYFENYIIELNQMIAQNISRLEDESIPEGRVLWVKWITFNYQLNKLTAMYSTGCSIEHLKDEFSKSVNAYLDEAWTQKTTKVHLSSEKYLDQYTIEPYSKMLKMLSIGYLLNVIEDDFDILADKIAKDNVSDNLYAYIVNARRSGNKKIDESYDKGKSVILKVFNKLRRSIEVIESKEKISLIKQYLQKDFYHKHSGFYNSHKSRANVYYGYWSFESAAIVAISGIDDSSLIDNEYYPRDLIEYYRSQVISPLA